MNRVFRTLVSTLISLRKIALVAIVSVAPPVLAQSYLGEDPSLLAKYRCGVLGETSHCAAAPPEPRSRIEDRVLLGPRAKYLIYLGVNPAAAVAQARLAGEVPVLELVRITTRVLSSTEAFDQANGRTIMPQRTVEVLSTTRILAESDAVSAHR